ncbi:hypothetical protein V6N13_030004 [Hibiscus sabdariffa]|uniref:Uncharacterized protein n=1 Tax=Hibiscus sabdariffa TaxID=183260 RepID=A0ABR2T8E6_9ROSI
MKLKLSVDNNGATLVIAREPRASIATCTDCKNLVKGLSAPSKDKDSVDSNPSVAQLSMVEHHLWSIAVGKMKIEGLVASFKGCIQLIQLSPVLNSVVDSRLQIFCIIGRDVGDKDLYFGTFSTQEEVVEYYDIVAIKFHGVNVVSRVDTTSYDVERIKANNTQVFRELAS